MWVDLHMHHSVAYYVVFHSPRINTIFVLMGWFTCIIQELLIAWCFTAHKYICTRHRNCGKCIYLPGGGRVYILISYKQSKGRIAAISTIRDDTQRCGDSSAAYLPFSNDLMTPPPLRKLPPSHLLPSRDRSAAPRCHPSIGTECYHPVSSPPCPLFFPAWLDVGCGPTQSLLSSPPLVLQSWCVTFNLIMYDTGYTSGVPNTTPTDMP